MRLTAPCGFGYNATSYWCVANMQAFALSRGGELHGRAGVCGRLFQHTLVIRGRKREYGWVQSPPSKKPFSGGGA